MLTVSDFEPVIKDLVRPGIYQACHPRNVLQQTLTVVGAMENRYTVEQS